MEEQSVFNRLIQGLTREERLEMLQKMQSITPLNDLPLKNDYLEEEYDYEISYLTFSLFEKIIIFFTVLFSSKERSTAIEKGCNLILIIKSPRRKRTEYSAFRF